MRIIHAYKIYMPEVFGGIPQVISMLTKLPGAQTVILTARHFGIGRRYIYEGTRVAALASLGTFASMPLSPFYAFSLLWRARRSDVVIHHAPFPLTDFAIWLGFPKRPKLIVYWHAEILGKKRLLRWVNPFIQKTLARADSIVVSDAANITNSPYLKAWADKCRVAPFGCDTDYWSTLTEAQRARVEHLKTLHPRLIVNTGRLVAYKGQDMLVRAMLKIDAHAVIIGDGPMKKELQTMAAGMLVDKRITFTGSLSRDDMKVYLHAADVFVFPSTTSAEAFGISQIEAMAVGLPIVNTSLPTAVPLIARHGHEAITVPPGQPIALSDAVTRLLDDPQEAEKLGRAAKERAISSYDQSAFLQKMSDIIADTTADRSPNSYGITTTTHSATSVG